MDLVAAPCVECSRTRDQQLCPLHWHANSYPLYHWGGSPFINFYWSIFVLQYCVNFCSTYIQWNIIQSFIKLRESTLWLDVILQIQGGWSHFSNNRDAERSFVLQFCTPNRLNIPSLSLFVLNSFKGLHIAKESVHLCLG